MGEMNPLIAIPKVSNKGTKVEYEVSELIQCKDVDKVVKGLGLCSSGDWNSPNRPCTDCPYYPAGYTGCAAKPLMRDALALILEQLGKINKLSMLAKADGIDVDKLFEHEEGRTVMTDHDKERYQEYMDKYRENKRKKERGHREKLLSSIENGKDAISNKPEQSSLDYMLYGLLIQCAEVLKKQEWNTITEDEDGNLCGLPPEDGDYFFYDGKYVWKDEYHNYGEDGITLNLAYDMSEVKAWMYIPEPPEE